ncbi:MAG: UvrD-helicase domain-containing protein [Verrucomicrobiales bacterium]
MNIPPVPSDQEHRHKISNCLDRNLLVEAAAGTGKTASMVDRMIRLISTGTCQIDTLVAVTFTRKAAAELRDRFHAALEGAERIATSIESDHIRAAWLNRERCFIGTIHSFCGRLLRERPVEAGVDLAFQELDKEADGRIRERAWVEFLAGAAKGAPDTIGELLRLGLEIDQLQDAFHHFSGHPDVDEWGVENCEVPDVEPLRADLLTYLNDMEAIAKLFPKERGSDKLMDRYDEILRAARQADLSDLAGFMDLLAHFDHKHGATLMYWPGGLRSLYQAEAELEATPPKGGVGQVLFCLPLGGGRLERACVGVPFFIGRLLLTSNRHPAVPLLLEHLCIVGTRQLSPPQKGPFHAENSTPSPFT